MWKMKFFSWLSNWQLFAWRDNSWVLSRWILFLGSCKSFETIRPLSNFVQIDLVCFSTIPLCYKPAHNPLSTTFSAMHAFLFSLSRSSFSSPSRPAVDYLDDWSMSNRLWLHAVIDCSSSAVIERTKSGLHTPPSPSRESTGTPHLSQWTTDLCEDRICFHLTIFPSIHWSAAQAACDVEARKSRTESYSSSWYFSDGKRFPFVEWYLLDEMNLSTSLMLMDILYIMKWTFCVWHAELRNLLFSTMLNAESIALCS